MSLYRRAAKRDHNEGVIVDTLRAQGFNVERVSGTGFPDLVATKGGQAWFIEVKAEKGRYKPAQVAFYERWTGPPIITLRSIDDALRFMLLAMEGRK